MNVFADLVVEQKESPCFKKWYTSAVNGIKPWTAFGHRNLVGPKHDEEGWSNEWDSSITYMSYQIHPRLTYILYEYANTDIYQCITK